MSNVGASVPLVRERHSRSQPTQTRVGRTLLSAAFDVEFDLDFVAC